jgi:hypothetical protein
MNYHRLILEIYTFKLFQFPSQFSYSIINLEIVEISFLLIFIK